MGFRIEAPKQDGNARFETLKVNLNENNSATRVVVVDNDGKFYYGTGGSGGASGSSGTSGANGSNGTSGTSGTGFNTINNALQGRLLVSDGTLNAATASADLFYDTGSSLLQINGGLETNNLVVNADVFEFTGSIKVNGSITGSLFGTASFADTASYALNVPPTAAWAINALTASSADNFYIRSDKFEFTGSLEVDGGITGSLLGTASFANTASYALNVLDTASWAINALTASSADNFYIRADRFEFTGSIEVSGSITGSLYGTSSWAVSASWAPEAEQAATASYVTASNVYGPYGSNSIISASYAATASSADNFYIRSDKFEFTGSLEVDGGITGSLFGTASYAETASYALNIPETASWAINALTASSADDFYIRADRFEFTGSIIVSGSITGSLYGTSSWAVSASWAPNSEQAATASYVTASNVYGPYGSNSIVSASYAATASSADNFYIRSDKFEFTGSLEVNGGITGSLLGTASFAETASYALNVPATASWAINALTASSANDFLVRGTLTAQTIVAQVITSSTEYVTGSTIFGSQLSNTHQFTGSVSITGSLSANELTVLSDKFEFTGSLEVDGGITGSLYGTSSWAVSASWAPNSEQAATASYVTASNVYGPFGSNSIISASYAATASSADSFIIRSDKFEFTGSIEITGSFTSSGDIQIRSSTSEPITIGRAYYSASNGNNLVFGHGALRSGSAGSNRNTGIGDYTLGTLQSGIENVAIGYAALFRATNNRNTAVGAYALFNTTGSTGFRNNAFGAYALAFNTTGEVNNAFGSYALYRNTVDDYNAAFGDFALYNLSTGSSNVAVGQAAVPNLRSGEGNVFIGRGAAPSLLSGSNNTIIGGITPSANINTPIFGLLTGSYNTIIGSNISGLSDTLNNNIILADGQGSIRARHDGVNWTVSGSLLPSVNEIFNLGSPTFKWKDLYLSGSTIYLGNTEIKEVNNQVTSLYGFSGSFTGSLFGTSSFTTNAATASSADNFYVRSDRFEFTGSVIVDGGITGSLFGTSSFATTASYALNVLETASYAINAATASSADSFIIRSDKFEFTGSVEINGGLTGSLFGTSSWAINALTASYIDPSNIPGISGFRIATGSVTASVNVTPESIFLINSGFTKYFNISSSGDTDIYSNLFIVRNFTTGQPVLTVSQSVIQIATQSFDPTGTTNAGSIWFTPYTMYIGLE